jgi:hypothetical protein
VACKPRGVGLRVDVELGFGQIDERELARCAQERPRAFVAAQLRGRLPQPPRQNRRHSGSARVARCGRNPRPAQPGAHEPRECRGIDARLIHEHDEGGVGRARQRGDPCA